VPEPLAAAVFASGSGSNLQALLDAEARGGAAWRTVLVISDRAEAGALDRARAAGAATRVIPVAGRDIETVAAETLQALDEAAVDVVFLAGYLRLVPGRVVARYQGRMLNVHPALLPAFGGRGMWGRRVHEAVLASGARITGPTVHLVDERYDEGRILGQWPVPVRPGDTPESLAARVLAQEHRLYPRVAEHLCRAVRDGSEVAPMDIGADIFHAERPESSIPIPEELPEP
jgi:phosphoribosylglycinamide formyltransferase 1